MQKHWLKIVAGCAALVILLILLVPFFIDADTFRPTLETQLSTALSRPITLTHLTFSLLKGSLVAQNISIADDPAFSTTPFLQAKSLQIGVEVLPLVFHRQVRITHLTVDTPSINLLHAANGRWNFSSIGSTAAKTSQSPQQVSALPDLTVDELKITDGSATVSYVPAVRKPFVYSGINLSVQQFSFLKNFPFSLSAKLPASGSLELTGNAGPLSQKNAADTPFQAKLNLKAFDPVAAGVLDAGAGITMSVDLAADLVSNGTSLTSRGTIQANHLQLARTGSPAPHPVNIDYEIADHLDTDAGEIPSISIHAGSVAAQVTGSYRLTPQTILLDLQLAAPKLPIDQVEELLPTFGVHLPTGSKLSGGSLTANLTVTGPAAATTIAGPIEIDNTTLQGFDIGSRIQGLNLFKSGGGTQIQTLRTTVHSSSQTTQFNDIYGNLPQIGTATGSGSVSPSEALDFKMVATLSSSNAVGAVANQAASAVSGFVGSFLHPAAKPAATNTNKGIPLTITGTASSPSIRANLGAMFK
ncbi:MAG TPA: AsmA family protein [Terracidiphilus sp.]|nr:AsmA family protein [Terracidiphilus sp.]